MGNDNPPSGAEKESGSNNEEHPIAKAIDRFVHRARDTKLAARVYLPIAQKVTRQQYEDLREEFERTIHLVESEDRKIRTLAQKEASLALVRFRRLSHSDVPGAIEVGLFLSLFASFDAFTGDLLRALYRRKPSLFSSINRSLTFADVLSADSLDSLKEQVLDDEIETIRRKSYTEQFTTIGNRFDIKLTAFDGWPDFVERSQRRNLLTHCDGVVSEQYVAVCREAGVKESILPRVGAQIGLGPEYFFESCELVLEVGLKLGHTLWRKTLPHELDQADSHLMSLLYSALESRQWKRARMIGAFAIQQRQMATDRNRKTVVVNYVQALKRSGEAREAAKVLASIDWSAASREFQLSDLVLRERWDEAASLMREMGPKDKLLTEQAYHLWPLFLEFRESDQFADAYQDLFGHSYSAKLEQELLAASEGAAREADRQKSGDGGEGDLVQPGPAEKAVTVTPADGPTNDAPASSEPPTADVTE